MARPLASPPAAPAFTKVSDSCSSTAAGSEHQCFARSRGTASLPLCLFHLKNIMGEHWLSTCKPQPSTSPSLIHAATQATPGLVAMLISRPCCEVRSTVHLSHYNVRWQDLLSNGKGFVSAWQGSLLAALVGGFFRLVRGPSRSSPQGLMVHQGCGPFAALKRLWLCFPPGIHIVPVRAL